MTRILSPREMDVLLEQPVRDQTSEGKWDRALLEVLYATGMRASEVVSLDVQDVNMDPRAPSIRCAGGRREARDIPLHDIAVEALQEYLHCRRLERTREKEQKALFVDETGTRLTVASLEKIVAKYGLQAQLGHVGAATIRQSFIDHMIRGGMPEKQVQELVGVDDFRVDNNNP